MHLEPTAAQIEAATRVQHAIAHELNLLAREGVSPLELVTGLGVAMADLITCTAGADKVAPWFARQAILVRDLQAGEG